jgi:hypothetical protein
MKPTSTSTSTAAAAATVSTPEDIATRAARLRARPLLATDKELRPSQAPPTVPVITKPAGSFRLHGCRAFVLDEDEKGRCKCPYITGEHAEQLIENSDAHRFQYQMFRNGEPVICTRKNVLVLNLTFQELQQNEEAADQERLRQLFVRHAKDRRDTFRAFLSRWAQRVKTKMYSCGLRMSHSLTLKQLIDAARDPSGEWRELVAQRHLVSFMGLLSDFWDAFLSFLGLSMDVGIKVKGATFVTTLKSPEKIERLVNRRGKAYPTQGNDGGVVDGSADMPVKSKAKKSLGELDKAEER